MLGVDTIACSSLADADSQVLAELVELQRSSYAVEAALIDYPDLPPLRETASDLARSGDSVLLVRVGGRPAGALFYTVDGRVLDISKLVVHPDSFRQGLASRLLAAVLGHPGIERVMVQTAAANRPAVRLYERNGFRITSREALPDGLVIVKLERRVSP